MILLLSTSDTDLLAAQASDAGYRCANPARTEPAAVAELLTDAELVIVGCSAVPPPGRPASRRCSDRACRPWCSAVKRSRMPS